MYDFVKWTAAPFLMLALRPKVYFENENAKKHVKGGALVVSNHTGYTDCVKLHFSLWYRRLHFVATKDMFEGRLSRWFFRRLLCIPVNKDNFEMRTFDEVGERLNEGSVVVIFPEGRINREGGIEHFKAGAVLMAMRYKVPVVPVVLIRPSGRFDRTRIAVGEPIDVSGGGCTLAGVNEIARMLRKKEEELTELVARRRRNKNKLKEEK